MANYRYRYTNTPSVIQGDVPEDEAYCYICGSPCCDFHHILNGSRKEFAESEGFWIWLCRGHHKWVHETPQGIGRWERWKRRCQEKYEMMHSHEEWMEHAHKNYR